MHRLSNTNTWSFVLVQLVKDGPEHEGNRQPGDSEATAFFPAKYFLTVVLWSKPRSVNNLRRLWILAMYMHRGKLINKIIVLNSWKMWQSAFIKYWFSGNEKNVKDKLFLRFSWRLPKPYLSLQRFLMVWALYEFSQTPIYYFLTSSLLFKFHD